MKKLVLAAATVVAMGSASFAMADSFGQAPTQQQSVKHGGFYVGAGAGYVSTALPEKTLEDIGIKNDIGHLTANAHAGYLFPVTDKFLLGVEGGYNYLPELKLSEITDSQNSQIAKTTSSYSIDFLGVAKYYLTDQLNVFAKAGGTYLNYDVKVDTLTAGKASSSTLSDSGVKPKVAIGLGYNVLPHLELTAEYSHTFGTNYDSIDGLDKLAKKNDKSDFLPANNAVLVGANYYFN